MSYDGGEKTKQRSLSLPMKAFRFFFGSGTETLNESVPSDTVQKQFGLVKQTQSPLPSTMSGSSQQKVPNEWNRGAKKTASRNGGKMPDNSTLSSIQNQSTNINAEESTDGKFQTVTSFRNKSRNKSSSKCDPHTKTTQTVEQYRLAKFKNVLAQSDINLAELRILSWRGIPDSIRGTVWKLLLGYLPSKKSAQKQTLERKRREYRDLIPRYFDNEYELHHSYRNHLQNPAALELQDEGSQPKTFLHRSQEEQKSLRQVSSMNVLLVHLFHQMMVFFVCIQIFLIHITCNDADDVRTIHMLVDGILIALHQVLVDLPRTGPSIPVLHHDHMQRCLLRVLFIWGMRHPGSGYVQGINDLLIPFLVVFLKDEGGYSIAADVEKIPLKTIDDVSLVECCHWLVLWYKIKYWINLMFPHLYMFFNMNRL